ncbi:succinate dehydrogenase, cytochrome b556 subunit [Arenimonas sp.]|uniref:succinate dehydrogenase, cytochrome b556 subunit n=1 Tax=Arenimonas sp. TaxID=1872635 RepID=UPI0039E41F8F
MAAPQRPLSPFMIGPYYRPQITSVLSLTHRATGVALAIGAFVLAGWLLAVAGGSESFACFSEYAGSLLGRIGLSVFAIALVYHFLNGIRHLLWDVGWGFEIPKVYATGYALLALWVVLSAAIVYVGWTAGGAA